MNFAGATNVWHNIINQTECNYMTPTSQEKRELIVAAKLCGEFTKDIEK
jgi:hypothetical protein